LSGLQFCTDLNGVSTDFPWVVVLFDSYFAQQWNLIVQTTTDGLSRYGIGVCQDCLTAYKKFLCAASAPGCGFYNCYTTALASATTCAAQCSTISTDFAVSTDVFNCVMDCYSSAMFASCSQFMLSRQTCANLLNICSCNPTQAVIDQVCQYFSPTGGITVDLGTGSCINTPRWCSGAPTSQSVGFALQSTEAGKSCPNPYFCLSIYNSVGANTVSNPMEVYNDQGGASPTNAASPLLLLALLLLLFV